MQTAVIPRSARRTLEMLVLTVLLSMTGVLAHPGRALAQTFPTKAAAQDSVLRRIWDLGMNQSQLYPLGQALLDSIGPRLTGTPQYAAAVEWLLTRYAAWGIPARKEQVDTFPAGWTRGTTHIDLVAPRVRTLEGTVDSWSPGTGGKVVEAEVVMVPAATDSSEAALTAWLATTKGKFVLLQNPEPTCRPPEDWERWALPGSEPVQPYPARREVTPAQLAAAGAAGVLHGWPNQGWGIYKIQPDAWERWMHNWPPLPTLVMSCEDYGLLARLALHQQSPKLRVSADASFQGVVPLVDVAAELKGTVKPNEYIVLREHLDSNDPASGATDDGAGILMMMETLRILKLAYPNPKRTILAWHWGGEELGMQDRLQDRHPEIVQGRRADFRQDLGTGRYDKISPQPQVKRWLAQVPTELSKEVQDDELVQEPWKVRPIPVEWNFLYTGHTNRDTFDKLSFDDLRRNATLTAMLVYLASEDPN